ncbi:MAG: M1 family aminopeptidase, partial [Saprospiraceae bacterium]
MNLIYDAMPFPNFVSVGGKFLALIWTLVSLLFVLMLTGIALQMIFGQPNIDFGLYVSKLFGELLLGMTTFVFLAFFIQTLVNHKFLGHALFVLFFIGTLVLSQLGFEHAMFQYGNADLGTYSEMNSFGHYIPTFSWFSIYWLGLAMLLYAAVLYFTVRGIDTKFMTRWKIGQLRLSRPLVTFGLASLLVFIASGCFVYYNTNVVNKYTNSDQREKQQADFEKTLKKYEFIPQLKIIDTYVEVDIRPEERDFTARGKYILKNKTNQPIQDIHVMLSPDEELTTSFEFNVGNELQEEYSDYKYSIYRLAQAVAPNDSIEMTFVSDFKTEGFRESGSNTEVLHNGTFFNNQYFPSFGYNANFELAADDERREYGLEEKERMMERDDPIGKKINLLTDDSDRMNFEAILSTAPDQIAIAPGYLQREWEENGRKYYHYKMDEPILGFYSIVSARYEVLRDEWVSADGSQQVNLEIYYHDGHDYNLDRMIKGMKKSLDYFTTNFSPYQYRQLRIMEFPRYRSFAQSFPNTVPFSEEIGFILKIEEDDVDIPFYVTAHEIGHQWWAHQVTEAQVKGNAMSSETMSQYSALMVMKKEYPPEMMQQFLKLELDRYLRGRNQETKKEQPLALVEGQGYIHYRKGSLVMYALQDYITEDSVNLALRRIIDKWAYREDEYITSDEYVKEFRKVTPDSLQYIITDMFETITLYENRAKSATYAAKDNQYEVTIDVNALKYRADSLGNETKIPIRDWIDVGVYTRGESGKDSLVYLKKHLIDQEEMQIAVMVDALPTKAGIDPINKLVDRNSGDNRVGVKELE